MGTALVQAPGEQPAIPEIFESSYNGMQAENGGVIGMLEVIMTDFERLQARTTDAETFSAKAHATYLADSKALKAQMSKDIEDNQVKLQDEEQALIETKEDLKATQDELQASLEYFEKLKPSCIEVGVSYEDRVARRKEEIESLQEALKIL